jgi:hypothetical protein
MTCAHEHLLCIEISFDYKTEKRYLSNHYLCKYTSILLYSQKNSLKFGGFNNFADILKGFLATG